MEESLWLIEGPGKKRRPVNQTGLRTSPAPNKSELWIKMLSHHNKCMKTYFQASFLEGLIELSDSLCIEHTAVGTY
jgi:hypothetical protein